MDADDVLNRLGARAALSHEEAARHLGLELVEDRGLRRVIVPRNRSRVRVEGWLVHRSDLSGDDVELDDEGLRITSATRTVSDLARVLPLGHAVAVADSAVRLGLAPQAALLMVLLTAFGHGSGRVRAVGRLVDGRSESVLESLLRVLLVVGGLPRPVLQYEVRDQFGRLVARVDMCWPAYRLIVEADGFAFHSDRRAYRHDRERLNELERLGWRVLRFSWEDVVGRREQVVGLVAECLAPRAA